MQCKQKSLYDLSAASLNRNTDVTRNTNDNIYLGLNRDNIFYLSSFSGLTTKFCYYIYNNIDLNFQIKALIGKVEIHSYTNDTKEKNFIIKDTNNNKGINYHHIADFSLDTFDKNGKNEYYGKIPKEYGYGQYLFFEIKPEFETVLNININYNEYMTKLIQNKETILSINNYNSYGYFEFNNDIDEVILTVTSLEKDYTYIIYIKTIIINIINGN